MKKFLRFAVAVVAVAAFSACGGNEATEEVAAEETEAAIEEQVEAIEETVTADTTAVVEEVAAEEVVAE